ncbi:nucleoside triphosphate pyrophosphohydrolase [Bacteroidales bacterium OttesenSCG-928-I21]|nr:nucleoside triphosphate pyrophosphohydrolase [Bacteroidales bacterium OttesenSCG-928-I21]
MNKKLKEFERLLNILDELRLKCPWDKKQTNESLRTLTIEEVYELSDAILKNNSDEIKKELGDILLHIVFYSKIGEEKRQFDIYDVLKNINEKLTYRHPHIFSDVKAETSKEVEENWERLKLKEAKEKTVLGGIPNTMPSMVKAYRIQDKVRGVGFDWTKKEQVWDKVKEEYEELMTEVNNNSPEKIEEEFGDFLFSIINAARLYGVNPDNALEKTNKKFIKRFEYLEHQTISQGIDLKNMSLDQMNEIWNEAKLNEKISTEK